MFRLVFVPFPSSAGETLTLTCENKNAAIWEIWHIGRETRVGLDETGHLMVITQGNNHSRKLGKKIPVSESQFDCIA